MEPSWERKKMLDEWLRASVSSPILSIDAMKGDASFRRYYRVKTAQGSFVAMDAPPPDESCKPFVAIANALRQLQLQTPEIIAEDIAHGFLLLTDFGDHTYLSTLNHNNADHLYENALSALCVLQHCKTVPGYQVPPFTVDFMQKEWVWHKEWFLEKLLGLNNARVEKVLDQTYALIAQSAANQPQVFMHRDYHSANLMALPTDDVGILDFQDAFIGPVTYDLASLLRDCYIDWPAENVLDWAMLYWQMLQSDDVLMGISQQEFLRLFDWMCLQRHLKALLTFARKYVRDQQPQYLKYIPRTLNYILQVSERYPELAVLHDYYQHVVQPAWVKKELLLCAP